MNGLGDMAEKFLDDNENGRWDSAEQFVDKPNGRYDRGEKIIEGNGKYDEGEEFIDIFGIGVWDVGE